ncbi:MAG: hypothetical protein KDN19_04925 [Verrucomicrobiae bacterium]|nr:hypothetical protein [Verrucomicrobiae bacterium]
MKFTTAIPIESRFVAAFALIGAVVAVSGCASRAPVSHGDATRYGETGGALTNFFTRRFSIGERGRHEFEITGLTGKAYPSKLHIFTKRSDPSGWRGYEEWEEAVLRVEILDYESRSVLASKTFSPKPHRQLLEGEYEHIFYGRGEPSLGFRERYRIRVTVLKPSPRQWDEARLELR